MGTLRVSTSPDGASALEIALRRGWRTRRLHVRSASLPLVAAAETGLLLALLPAMEEGGDLEVEGPVSPRLLAALPRIQDLFCAAKPRLRAVRVRAEPGAPSAAAADARRTASFFSGGADSMHTAVTRTAQIDALLFVHGFDIDLARVAQRRMVAARLREAAATLGKELVEVETDARAFTDGSTGWNLYHGAFLAATGCALGGSFRKFLYPPTDPPSDAMRFGSHPDLDALWSTETVEFEHDGAGTLRVERLAALSRHPVFNAHLRLCYKTRDGEYNCGRCDKCRRTRMYLRAVGAQGLCRTLPPAIGADEIDALSPVQTNADAAERALRHLRARGGDPELEEALLRLRERCASALRH